MRPTRLLTALAVCSLTTPLLTHAIPVEQNTLTKPSAPVVRYIDSSGNPAVTVTPVPANTTAIVTPVAIQPVKITELQQQISDLNERIARQDGQIDQLQLELGTLKQKLATTSASNKKVNTPTRQAERAAAPVVSKTTVTNNAQGTSKSITTATPVKTTTKTTTTKPASSSASKPVLATTTTKSTTTSSETKLTDKAAYNKAYEAYQQGGAAKAIAPMQSFIRTYPDSPYISNAHYWLGEFNLAITPAKYATARQHFQKVISTYPQSSKAPAALYRLIEISQNIDHNTSKANQYYQQLQRDYASSREAQQAKKQLRVTKS